MDGGGSSRGTTVMTSMPGGKYDSMQTYPETTMQGTLLDVKFQVCQTEINETAIVINKIKN